GRVSRGSMARNREGLTLCVRRDAHGDAAAWRRARARRDRGGARGHPFSVRGGGPGGRGGTRRSMEGGWTLVSLPGFPRGGTSNVDEKPPDRQGPQTMRTEQGLGPVALTESVKRLALDLGFDRVAIGPAEPPEHGVEFRRWVEAGHAGTMAYLERRCEDRLDPARLLPGATSIVCVALNYYQGETGDPSWEPVARYAWGRDYHDVMDPKLEQLADHLRSACDARSRA